MCYCLSNRLYELQQKGTGWLRLSDFVNVLNGLKKGTCQLFILLLSSESIRHCKNNKTMSIYLIQGYLLTVLTYPYSITRSKLSVRTVALKVAHVRVNSCSTRLKVAVLKDQTVYVWSMKVSHTLKETRFTQCQMNARAGKCVNVNRNFDRAQLHRKIENYTRILRRGLSYTL